METLKCVKWMRIYANEARYWLHRQRDEEHSASYWFRTAVRLLQEQALALRQLNALCEMLVAA